MATPTYAIKGSTSMNEGTAQIITFQTTGLSEGATFKYSLSGVLPWRIQGNLSSGTLTVGSTGQASLYIWVNADYYTNGASNLVVSVPGTNASLSIAIDDTTKTPSTLYTVQQATDFYNSQRTAFNGTYFGTAAIYDSAANIAANTALLGGSLYRVAASIIPIEPFLSSTAFYGLYSKKNVNTNIIGESIKDSGAGIISSFDKINQFTDYLIGIEKIDSATFSITANQFNSYPTVISKIINLDLIEIRDSLKNIGALNVSSLPNSLFNLKITNADFNSSVVGAVVSQIDLRELGTTSFSVKNGGTVASPSLQINLINNDGLPSSITLGQEISKLSIVSYQSNGNIATYFVNKAQASVTKTNEVFTVTTNGHSDVLSSIQRFVFSDKSLAFDLGGTTGKVVKYIGAIFGAAQIQNPNYVGIGLNYLDKKLGTDENLVNLALTTALGAGYTKEQEVQLLFKNLLNQTATKADVTYWGGLIDSGVYTPASLAVYAANSDFNTTNINLVGLVQSGVEYIPVV